MKFMSLIAAMFAVAYLSACAPAPAPHTPGQQPSSPVDAQKPTPSVPGGNMMMCTEEAKLCPDGKTYVGRNSSQGCAFDPCPGEKH